MFGCLLCFPSGALRARRVSSAASRLPGITSPRFALHGWQRKYENTNGTKGDNINGLEDEYISGLKDHVVFNRQFFSFLVKNYESLGLYYEADDAYYLGKTIENQSRPIFPRIINDLLLDWTFGYGTKPSRLIISSFWIIIVYWSIYLYIVKLQGNRRKRSIIKTAFKNPKGINIYEIFWCLHHSIDQLTPGIDLNSKSKVSLKRLESKSFLNKKSTMYIENSQKLIGWYILLLLVVMFGKIGIR
ncbi:MAG: hypothetical protein RPU90_17360 [Candidatus Sedimenticola sp. (ex Thyasira tokunagai)]